MELIAGLANGFIELFKAGAATFMSWVVNIIPLVVVLMTAVSACIKLIGEEKVYSVAGVLTKSIFTRYTLLPVISVLFLANPMCYTFGRFVKEEHKPSFYDSTVSFLLGDLAVRYFIVGVIVIFIRGVVTEKIFAIMKSRN